MPREAGLLTSYASAGTCRRCGGVIWRDLNDLCGPQSGRMTTRGLDQSHYSGFIADIPHPDGTRERTARADVPLVRE